ncbi:MAG TPA: EAL domain-containing protein [Permianibacter sp.]|nr:EAL domain-containing protein [Permianibacter sp.]
MSNKIRTIHLLLLDPSSNDAEHTTTLLRNNGFAVRATQIVTEDELKAALEKQAWDMLIAKPAAGEFTVEKALRIIEHYNRDTPIVLLTDSYSSELLVEMLRLGIKDVVPANEEERVRLVVGRELLNVEDRRRRKQAEAALRETEKRCDLLLASSRDAIAYIHDGMHIYANKAYTELFGYEDPDDLASMPIMDMITDEYHDQFKSFLREYATNADITEFHFKGQHAEGETFDAVLTLSAAKYDGEECTQVLIRRDADSAVLEQKLKELSAVDSLTGLFNRQHLVEKLALASDRASKQEGMSALVLMELDQFNNIKSRFGLTGTDHLMRDCADFLRRKLDEDILLARIGDDGFAALASVANPDAGRELGERLAREFSAHLFEVEGHTVKTTLSVGVMPIGENAPDPEQLIGNAHAVLVMVKQKGGNGCKMFNPSLLNAGDADRHVLLAVQEALDTGRAYLQFQPIIKMHGKPGAYYSVLLRIKDEKGNHVSPEQVFPVAEQAGIASKLDRWVITEAMRTLAAYKGKEQPKLFVQLSGAALMEESLPSFIGQNLRVNRLEPNAIVFQINEHDANEHLKRCLAFLQGLKKVGGLACLAGYGSTDHSEQLLKDMIIDFVRFDGKFAPILATNQEALGTVKRLLDLAKEANKLAIIPRVEDAGCIATLYPLDVDYVQGFFLQPPMEKLDFDFSASEF